MKRQHYKANKETSKKIWNEYKKNDQVVQDFLSALCTEYKADAIYKNSSFIFGYILFDTGHKTPRGFSQEIKREISGDLNKKFTVFYPDGRFKEGKKFKEMCDQYHLLILKHPSFSNYVKSKYNIDVSIGHSGYLHVTVAGYMKETCLISVAVGTENEAPNIEGFEKIKKSEYVSITEE